MYLNLITYFDWTMEGLYKECINMSFLICHALLYLFGVLRPFQHCTGHMTMGSWKGRGNQYIQFVRVLYCKLSTNSKQLPAFPLEAMTGTEPRPQRWEARVLPLCHRGPLPCFTHEIQIKIKNTLKSVYREQSLLCF